MAGERYTWTATVPSARRAAAWTVRVWVPWNSVSMESNALGGTFTVEGGETGAGRVRTVICFPIRFFPDPAPLWRSSGVAGLPTCGPPTPPDGKAAGKEGRAGARVSVSGIDRAAFPSDKASIAPGGVSGEGKS